MRCCIAGCRGPSLDTQLEGTRAHVARQQGWVIEGEYVDIMSGKRADRPGYQAMLARARELARDGKRVAIVLVRLDPFGRRVREYLNQVEPLTSAGATIHESESGEVYDEEWATMKMVWAQKEGKLIGQRVSENRATVVRNGWWYGRVPFGYGLRPATPEEIAAGCRASMAMIEPDPLTRDTAKQVFERIANGESAHSVARWLADRPPAMRGNRAWSHPSVRALLRSPSYVARPPEGAEDVLARPVSRWEALISDELFATVQRKLEGHNGPGRWPSGHYLLTGFLKCTRCVRVWELTAVARAACRAVAARASVTVRMRLRKAAEPRTLTVPGSVTAPKLGRRSSA
jgi:site-specific DNA recombinase